METGKVQGEKRYDLEERTLQFAQRVVEFLRELPGSIANREIARQLVRSSGSVGANYIEANESLGKKDFVMRVKICRKESKESAYWLKLAQLVSDEQQRERESLIGEATELTKIFGSIIEKTK